MNISRVQERAFIQGGSFRLDRGPTKTEAECFRLAAILHDECRKAGKTTAMGFIVNDLALSPQERPKATLRMAVPEEYLAILQEHALIGDDDRMELIRSGSRDKPKAFFLAAPEGLVLHILFESSLRNAARNDLRSIIGEANESGKRIPHCPAIMGKFYDLIAKFGYSQQIGFYTYQSQGCGEGSCPRGPTMGAIERASGYAPRIAIANHWVYPNGLVSFGLCIDGEKA